MKIEPYLFAAFDDIPKTHCFYSLQFKDGAKWYRDSEFDDMKEIEERDRFLKDNISSRSETRVVSVKYEIL